MNRPNREDYKINESEYSYGYVQDLEKYCDELEKALDKACYKLRNFQIECFDMKDMFVRTKEEWKELLMQDENK